MVFKNLASPQNLTILTITKPPCPPCAPITVNQFQPWDKWYTRSKMLCTVMCQYCLWRSSKIFMPPPHLGKASSLDWAASDSLLVDALLALADPGVDTDLLGAWLQLTLPVLPDQLTALSGLSRFKLLTRSSELSMYVVSVWHSSLCWTRPNSCKNKCIWNFKIYIKFITEVINPWLAFPWFNYHFARRDLELMK